MRPSEANPRRRATAKAPARASGRKATKAAAPSAAPSLGLDELLCFALYSANHAMGRIYQPLLDDLGVTYPQYLVLVALWTHDDQRVGALGVQLHLESNTLTPLLKRMETQGLVTRRRDDDDERVVRVTITPAGRALQHKAKEITRCVVAATSMSLPELTALRGAVARLRDALLEHADGGDPG